MAAAKKDDSSKVSGLAAAQEAGFFGVKVDPHPNEVYTVGGKGAKVFNGPDEPAEYVKANTEGGN